MAIDPNEIKKLREEAAELGSVLSTYTEKIKDNAKLIREITGDSIKAYDPQISKTKKLAEELQKISGETLASAKERGKIEKSLNEVQKDLLSTQAKRESIAKRLTTATKAEQKILIDILDSYDDTISSSKELIENTKKLASVFVDIERNLGITGDILDGISKIPIVNKFLDTKKALEAANKEAAKLTGTRWSVLGAALKSLGQSLKKNLTDPLVYVGLATKFFKELVDMGLAFSQRTAEIARNFGISSKEAEILNQRFSDITLNSKNTLLNQKSLLEATTQINDRFGTSVMLTESLLAGQIDLTKRLGLSAEEAAIFAEYSLKTGESQESIVNSIGKQNKGVLSNKKIIQDVAKVNGQLYAQYKGSPRLIAQAVIQSQKLGITLQQAKDISSKLLNFEESISAELEAELLTGQDLNLEKARYLALQGDSAGAAAELMKNLGPNGLQKFQNFNVIQQEAYARALGMSADELTDSLRTQQALSKLSVNEKKAYKDAIKAAQDKGEYEKAASLEKQMNQGKEFKLAETQLNAQDRFNNAVDKLKGLLASIVEGPLGKMAEQIVGMIEKITKIPGVGKILGYAAPIAAVLGGTLFAASMTRGTNSNPMITEDKDVSGGGGGLFGGGGGGTKPTGLKRITKAFGKGGMKGGGKAISRMLKSSVKGVGGKLGVLGALASLGMDVSEGGLNAESIGRSLLTGGGSLLGAALVGGPTLGAGAIAGGIGGGIAGDYLGDAIFGERKEMALGGIVTRPTRALVGEAGPEAVIPLNQLMNEFKAMRDAITNRPITVSLVVDGKVLAQAVGKQATTLGNEAKNNIYITQ